MLRRLLIAAPLVLSLIAAYALSPFVAAWQIREAVRTADNAVLTRKVDWTSVRRSLKSSLGETRRVLTEITDAAHQPRPGFWRRVKAAVLPFVTDPLIDRYVTADGAPRLYKWRQSWRDSVRPRLATNQPVGPLAGTWLGGTSLDRGLVLARRIERWSFVSPGRLEVEISDTAMKGRRWFAALELKGFDWQLTEMRVLKGGSLG